MLAKGRRDKTVPFLCKAFPQSEVCCDCFRPEEGQSTIWWNYLLSLLCFIIKQIIFFIKKRIKITFCIVCFWSFRQVMVSKEISHSQWAQTYFTWIMASVGSSRGFSLLREAKEFFAFSVTLLQHSDKQILNKIKPPNISQQKPMLLNNITEKLRPIRF